MDKNETIFGIAVVLCMTAIVVFWLVSIEKQRPVVPDKNEEIIRTIAKRICLIEQQNHNSQCVEIWLDPTTVDFSVSDCVQNWDYSDCHMRSELESQWFQLWLQVK